MRLLDIIYREPPIAWEKAGKIPWHDPNFSRRMLESHLSQAHDWASRRYEIIDRHVKWIADHLSPKNARLLDLGCGPGLYTHRLAELGFSCTGVDISPASIECARQQADSAGLDILYTLEDIRRFQPNETFDCVMLTFGEFNVFNENDAVTILQNAAKCLRDDGFLLLETQIFEAVKEAGQASPSWQTLEQSVFSDLPHLWLQENFWDESTATATTRYIIIDAGIVEDDGVDTVCANVREYGASTKAYTDSEYKNMLHDVGFTTVESLSSDDWPGGTIFEGKLQTCVWRKR